VETLLSREGKELKKEMEQLIRVESVEKTIENNISILDALEFIADALK